MNILRMNTVRAGLTAAALILVSSCGTSDEPSTGFTGQWTGKKNMTITISADGTAEGHDGCNEFAATWSESKDSIAELRVTEMSEAGCPDGLDGWADLSVASIYKGRLLLETDDGRDLGMLDRTP